MTENNVYKLEKQDRYGEWSDTGIRIAVPDANAARSHRDTMERRGFKAETARGTVDARADTIRFERV